MNIPLQVGDVVNASKDILSIQTVSVVGMMLFFIAYLITTNYLLKKEMKEKDAVIIDFIGKFTAIYTELKHFLSNNR